MDNHDRARRHADDATRSLKAHYDDAVQAFQRLQEARQRGDRAPELDRTFRVKAEEVHAAVAAARVAHADLRRAMHHDETRKSDSFD
jgi:hypothetical protein